MPEATVLIPTSGSARVLGHDVVEDTKSVRPLIGIVFGGERGLYSRLAIFVYDLFSNSHVRRCGAK